MSKISEIRALARAGSSARAWTLFQEEGLESETTDQEILCLKGRLLKDQAKAATGEGRTRLFAESAAAYGAAADIGRATYPLINAATLVLFAGRAYQARILAQRTLELLDSGEYEPETAYWLAATRAEALLLLERTAEAKEALAEAMTKAPAAWEDHAATLGQFALILEETGGDASWLDRYRPPRSLHFQGIMGIAPDRDALAGRIGDRLDAVAPGFGFGALAAGADILIAEALVSRDAELHVTLPCPRQAFRERSVVAVDPGWGPRFDALIEAAATVEVIGTASGPSPAAVTICEEAAMGLALRNARILASEAALLCVTDQERKLPASAQAWQRQGWPAEMLAADRSAKVPAAPQGAAQTPMALASIDAGTSDAPAPPSDWQAARGGRRLHGFADIAALTEWMDAALVGRDREWSVALDYGPAEAAEVDPHLLDRLEALAQVTRTGQIRASRAMAMALELHAPAQRIEEAGEMRWAGGTTPFFSILAA